MKQAFVAAKCALVNATMLAHPCSDCPLALTSDASDRAVGAVQEQFKQGQWQPLAFFSRQLRNAELKYSAFDRELLGVHLAIRHFRFMLEGRHISVYTDHKPLVHATAKTAELWSSRQQRHLSAISEFTTDIRHVSGKNNTVADCLCRATTANTVSLGIDYTLCLSLPIPLPFSLCNDRLHHSSVYFSLSPPFPLTLQSSLCIDMDIIEV